MRLAVLVLSALFLIGALVTPRLRWRRTAFAGFLTLGLFSFALRAGWPSKPLTATACEGLVGAELALHSFRNTPHILLRYASSSCAHSSRRLDSMDAHAGGRAPPHSRSPW